MNMYVKYVCMWVVIAIFITAHSYCGKSTLYDGKEFMFLWFMNFFIQAKNVMGFYENFVMGQNLYVYARKGNRLKAAVRLELAFSFLLHSKRVMCLARSFRWI